MSGLRPIADIGQKCGYRSANDPKRPFEGGLYSGRRTIFWILAQMPSELPDNLVPYLQAVNQRMFEGQAPLDFWRMDDDRSIVTGFMDLVGLCFGFPLKKHHQHFVPGWPGLVGFAIQNRKLKKPG